jgi:hypothetical protein
MSKSVLAFLPSNFRHSFSFEKQSKFIKALADELSKVDETRIQNGT